MPAESGGKISARDQYLTLRLGGEEYAIEILRVQEIRSFEEPTRMVNTPDCVRGVLDLRGVIVPIVDLRLMLGVGEARLDDFTVVIVLNVDGQVVGVVVDAVSDVVELVADSIKPAPQFESAVDARFIAGLVDLAGRMLIVLRIEALLADPELGLRKTAP